MKVRYVGNNTTVIPAGGAVVAPGDVVDVDDRIAERLVASGRFERVRATRKT